MDEGDSKKLMAKVRFEASASLGSSPQVLSLRRLYRRPKDSFLSASFQEVSKPWTFLSLSLCQSGNGVFKNVHSYKALTYFEDKMSPAPPPCVKVLGLGPQLGMVF